MLSKEPKIFLASKARNVSLKSRIILWVIGGGALPLLLGMLISYDQSHKSLEEVIGSSFQALAQESSGKVDFILREELERIKTLARHPVLIKTLEQENAALQELEKAPKELLLKKQSSEWQAHSRSAEALTLNPGSTVLKQFNEEDSRLHDATRALFAIGLEGVLASSINFYPDFDLTRQTTFPQASAGPFLHDIMPDRETSNHVFYIAAPVLNDAGTTVGTVYRLFSAETYFSSIFEGIRFGTTGHVMIINADGVVISCPILPTGFKLDSADMVKRVTQLKPGWAETPNDGHGGQETSLIGFSPLLSLNTLFESTSGSRWHTFVWQASEELFAPMNKLILWVTVTGLFALALIVGFGIIAADRILKPVRKLREALTRIGEGSDAETVPVTSQDEIGELEKSFNKMAKNLHESRKAEQAHLEKLKHSEERIRLIVDNVVDGIITINKKGIVLSFNPAAEKIFGYPACEVLGNNITMLMPESQRNLHENSLQKYLSTGIPKIIGTSVEIVGLRKNGEPVPATLEISELIQDGEKCFVAVLRDDTERRRMESQLRKLSMAVEQSPSAVMITNTDGIIEYVNPGFCSSTGYEFCEAIGQSPRILKSGIHPDKFYQKLWAGLLAGKEWRGEFCNRKKNGDLYWELQTIAPLRDAEGNISHFLSVKIDDTERKRAEEQLKVYSAELERSNEALKDFASIASHDLQEPLRKIIIFGDRLQSHDSALDESGKNYLSRMIGAAERMRRFILDLLEYSRVSSAGQQFETTDLNEVLTNVLTDLEMSLQQSGGTVQVEGSLPTLEVDALQMGQLFLNLIGNALKFHKDGDPPKIQISAHRTTEGLWRIDFQDNGIGFDIKNLPRILKPFQRLHGRDKFSGSGMGLTICHKIVSRHGGALTAESTPGEGTTFTVEIPEKQKASPTANILRVAKNRM